MIALYFLRLIACDSSAGASAPPPSPPKTRPPPTVETNYGSQTHGVPVVNQVSTAKAGYTTYQVAVAFDPATVLDV